MARGITFERLPVGACYAYESGTTRATRKKVDPKHVTIIPGGNRTYRVEDIEMRVHEKACPVNFGRRRRRKRSR